MKQLLLGGLVVSALLSVTLMGQGGGKADLEALQGEWLVVGIEKDGVRNNFAEKERPPLTFKGESYMMPTGKGFTGSKSGKIKLTKGAKLKQLDMTPDDGPYKGMTLLGVYRVDDEVMRACFALPGKARPVAYTTEPDSGRVVVHLMRKP